jgi:hypothetical protein
LADKISAAWAPVLPAPQIIIFMVLFQSSTRWSGGNHTPY